MSLSIINGTKSYDGKKNVLNNLQATFPDKGIYGIVGRSGQGKSTLINIIAGLDSLSSGEIYLNGVNTTKNCNFLRENISVVYQEYHLLPEINVYQNIEVAVKLANAEKSKDDILKAMESLGIKELANRRITALSGGEKQRVALARAYLSDKQIIVADEPTGNLDFENGKYVFSLLREIAKEKLVIVVSHDAALVDEYIDNIYELSGGVLQKSEKIAIESGLHKSESDDINISSIAYKQNNLANESHSKRKARKAESMGIKYYLKFAIGFLIKKKTALICMLIISSIALSIFTASLSILNVNAVDQLMQKFKNSDIEFSFASGDFTYVDNDILNKYSDKFAVGIKNNAYIVRDLTDIHPFDSDKDKKQADITNIFELPSTDIGLNIIHGKIPKDYTEFIISIKMVNNIITAGSIIDGAAHHDSGVFEYLPVNSVDDILGKDFYLIDKKVKLVGVFDDNKDKWMERNEVFFGKGMLEYIKSAEPFKFAENAFPYLDLDFAGGQESFGYTVSTIGLAKFDQYYDHNELIDIEGMAPSRMPAENNEVILECPVLSGGRKIYFHKVGDYITLNNAGVERKYKIVGYYTSGEFYDEPIFKPTLIMDKVFKAGAFMTDDALVEYSNTVKNSYSLIAVGNNHDRELYQTLFDSGISFENGVELNLLTGTYLPLGIILGVASLLLALTCIICSIVVFKGNFKSMAILNGIGAKSRHTAIITLIMSLILCVSISIFGLPIAFALNVIYNLYNNIGIAIGAAEIFASIGALLGIFVIAIAIITFRLRKEKLVNALRVE